MGDSPDATTMPRTPASDDEDDEDARARSTLQAFLDACFAYEEGAARW